MSHVIMKKNLAKALMDAGMEHFDVGGAISPIGGTGGQLLGMNEYSASAPTIATQNFQPRIDLQQQQQNQVYNQQQTLGQQLLNQSNGAGPNPALAQLNQTTGANVANQAALAASARGASSNPALIARLAATQGAGIQQNAVGQAATLNAQQQLNAENSLQNLYSTAGNEALQGESIEQGGQASQNSAITSGQLGASQINANISGQNAKQAGGILSGITNAVGDLFYDGGEVKKYASGGAVSGIQNYAMPALPTIPMQQFDPVQIIPTIKRPPPPVSVAADPLAGGPGDTLLDSQVSPGGEMGTDSPLLMTASNGGQVPFSKALMANGGKVKGKEVVSGNSPKNDDVPALLSAGEVVLPKSVTQAKDAPQKAAEFLRHLQEEKKGKGYGGVLSAKKSLKDRVAHLEKLCGGGMASAA